jgi:hypothetical protein
MTDRTDTRVERAMFRGKETTSLLLDADNMSCRGTPDGGMVLELFRYNDAGRAVESYRFYLSAGDRKRLRHYL